MMSHVAQMVTEDHDWARALVGLIIIYGLGSLQLTRVQIIGRSLGGFWPRLKARAKLCLDQTGFVGALIARHTLLVTMNVLALNLSLNMLSAIKAMDDHSAAYGALQYSLMCLALVCVAQVLVIAAITLALCNEVIHLAERKS